MQIGMQTYKASLVKFFFGSHVISGFGDDTFIEAEFTGDAFETNVGAAGDVSRSQNMDESGKVVITLKGESQSNDVLSGLAQLDRLVGSSVLPLLVKDGGGTTLVQAGQAWIKKPANVGFGKKREQAKWEFACAKMYMKVGGTLPIVSD